MEQIVLNILRCNFWCLLGESRKSHENFSA